MKKSVELTLGEPIFSTYHNQCPSACIQSNKTIRNWYLNESVNFKCGRDFLHGYTSPNIDVVNANIFDNPYLEKQWYSMKYLNGYINYVIRCFLDNGFYVYYDIIDDYYIEGKTWYKKRHFGHDAIIFGYNQENKTYSIYAYNDEWICKKFYISQNSFNKGRISMFKRGRYGHICGFKPCNDKVEFDLDKVLKNLSEYLDSSLEKYPTSENGQVFGIVAYDYISMYINMLIAGTISYSQADWRIFRIIWEHKKIMLERIEKIEEVLNLGTKYSEPYKAIVNGTNKLRMQYAIYCMHNRRSVLPIIAENLLKVKEQEKYILDNLIKNERNKDNDTLGLHKKQDAE